MIWYCPKCGGENNQTSGICGGCFVIKPDNIAVVKSAAELQAESYKNAPTPSWTTRMFSLKHRITRTDFALVLAAMIALRFALLLLAFSPTTSTSGAFIGLGCYLASFLVLLISAGKRARDMGHNEMWGVFSIFLIFGLVILLFGRGDKGANKFGPDPRNNRA